MTSIDAYSFTDPRDVRPLGLFAVVQVEGRQRETASGIALPDKEMGVETVMEGAGRVIAVGPGEMTGKGYLKKPCVKVGDRVAFRRFLKDSVPFMVIDGDEFCLMHSNDFMAKLDDDVEIGPF